MEASTPRSGARCHHELPSLCLASVTPLRTSSPWPGPHTFSRPHASCPQLRLLIKATFCTSILAPRTTQNSVGTSLHPRGELGSTGHGRQSQFPFLSPEGLLETQKFYRASPKTSSEMDSFQKASRMSMRSPLLPSCFPGTTLPSTCWHRSFGSGAILWGSWAQRRASVCLISVPLARTTIGMC